MALTAAQISEMVGGTVVGDKGVEIYRAAGLQEAGAGDISFLANPKYAAAVADTRASAVIVPASWDGECSAVRICVADPDRAFAIAAAALAPPPVAFAPGVHPSAVVADDASLGDGVCVGPCCVVEPGARIGDRTVLCAHCYVGHGVSIGSDCRVYPFASLREHVRIGDRVILHNGAVIGSDGFGYFREGEQWRKIPQVGTVEIGDDVEVGANTTIDRARFGVTIIGPGVKIDNLVQVAHNVCVGENTAIAAQVGISGSTRIGKNVQLGGQAGVAGHLEVGDHVVVAGKAGVTKSIPGQSFVSGFPAMPHGKATRMHAHMMRLPELKARVRELEEQVQALREGAAGQDDRGAGSNEP